MNCTTEEEKEILELNIKNAVKCELGLSLSKYLAAYTVDRLKILSMEHELPNRSKLKKAELVVALQSAILNEERLTQEMIVMSEEEFQFLLDVAHGHDFAGQAIHPGLYGYACRLGYLYLVLKDDVLHYEMPPEVKALVLDSQTHDFLKKMADYRLKWEYISGLSNFYGMVTYEEVARLYNEYNETDITPADLEDVFRAFSIRPQITQYYDGYLVNDFLLEEDEFELLSERVHELPLSYIPSEEEILAYADDMYYEWTPELDKLERYLAESFNDLSEDDIHQLVEDIQLSITMEDSFQDIFDLFEGYELKFSSFEQVEEIGQLITDVINNTRLWSNRGYTPKELNKLNGSPLQEPPEIEAPKQEPIRVQKIGRNDPCPCGSGKKYKKCCGK